MRARIHRAACHADRDSLTLHHVRGIERGRRALLAAVIGERCICPCQAERDRVDRHSAADLTGVGIALTDNGIGVCTGIDRHIAAAVKRDLVVLGLEIVAVASLDAVGDRLTVIGLARNRDRHCGNVDLFAAVCLHLCVIIVLIKKLLFEGFLHLLVAAVQQIVNKLLRRHVHGTAVCICQILHGIIYKGISKNQFCQLFVSVSCVINRINRRNQQPPRIPCFRTVAHHFAGNAGKISRLKLRAILEQTVDVRNAVSVCQAGKIHAFQVGAALKGTAQMCNTRIVAVKFGSGLHNHSLQIFKVLKQTVAVCRQHSLEHDLNMLDLVSGKIIT